MLGVARDPDAKIEGLLETAAINRRGGNHQTRSRPILELRTRGSPLQPCHSSIISKDVPGFAPAVAERTARCIFFMIFFILRRSISSTSRDVQPSLTCPIFENRMRPLIAFAEISIFKRLRYPERWTMS